MGDNPFGNRYPIKKAEYFFGRKDELKEILSLIGSSQSKSISIIGDRRLGKSSLLYQVYLRYRNILKNPDDYQFLYLDLQGKTEYSSPESFYKVVMQEAKISCSEPIDYHAFKEGLKKIIDNKKLVLLLDEFDVLIKNERFDSGFLEGLRSLAQKYDISYIITSQRPLKDICHQEAKGSPFFNIFHQNYLAVFKPDEAKEMLVELSTRGGRRFPEDTIKAMLAYVGYHPFLIQLLAYYVFDELERDGSFESAKERFLSEARSHLEYYRNHLTDKERTVIEDLNKSITQFNDKLKEHLKINKEEINRLKDSGWLIEKDGEYQLVPVFPEGLIQQKFMRLAIEEAKKSNQEKGKIPLYVGAVVVKDEKVLAQAHRGEIAQGEHAEYTVLERKLPDVDLTGATLYTTLEPCTTRNHPKVPCAKRIIQRMIGKVVVGILDPNPEIRGKGVWILNENKVIVEHSPHTLQGEIINLNHEFIAQQRGRGDKKQTKEEKTNMRQNINITGSSGVNIIQAGGDIIIR